MKIRFLIAACLGWVSCQSPDLWGQVAPARAPLPNYDQRAATASPAFSLSKTATDTQDQAAYALKSVIPDLQIARDRVVGSPRLISSANGFLTGPGGIGKAISASSLAAFPESDSNRVVKAFLNQHAALFRHDAGVLNSASVRQDYVTAHNGLRTVIWQQTLDGIPVFDGLLVGHITRNGELVSLASAFVPDPAKAADAGTPNRTALAAQPNVTAAKAIANAAQNVGVDIADGSLTVLQPPQGVEKSQTQQATNLLGPASAQLVWLPLSADALRLCWRVSFIGRVQGEGYSILVDALTGEVLVRRGFTEHIAPAVYNVFPSDSPSPFSPGWPDPSSEQPPLTNRVLIPVSALSITASPLGWISDGNNQTFGNNAITFRDRNLDGVPDIPLPQGVGPNRTFDYPLGLTNDPVSYADASTVQLFYRANWFHDRLYDLGFTEAAGNFQTTNFNRGGLGNDSVVGLVQAGADVGFSDNSAFSTPPDGQNGYCFMFVFTGPTPSRDGSLDQEVVCHELTHGVSSRLLGGGVGISALQSEGMGEGWSDFYSLCLLSEPTDNVDATYAEGGYASYLLARSLIGFDFTENYYYGIRRYPYTTDMSKNPLTFKDIDPTRASTHDGVPVSPLFGGSDPSEVHNQGEVWCVTLREVWASLVKKYGWDIGNELVLQLVTDGLKLAPANATFLEARDAIIRADQVDTSGQNYKDLWFAFAKRGMGFSAACPTSDTTTNVIEAFDLPRDARSDGFLEVNVVPPSGTALFVGDTVPIRVRVTDTRPVTDATISATATPGGALDFLNDGVPPDETAGNEVYTATLDVPTNATSITIRMVISAAAERTTTNTVTYPIFVPPPNDNFTNAIKVPRGGTNYLSTNKRATIEPFEPFHAGDASAAASLWWDYTAANATNVLVDAGGSDFTTVVAVYTNNTLATLQPVASAVGSAARKGAFTFFDTRPGVTYHIAIAGINEQSTGTLKLNIAPGGQPDTNAPLVTITSPPSGILTATNRIAVTGTAADQGPSASGVSAVSVTVAAAPTFTALPVTGPGSALSGPLSTNWSTTVTLQPGLNLIQATATDFLGNRSAPVIVQATYRVLDPINDFFANAITLTNLSGVASADTDNATKEAGEPDHGGNAGGKSVWWSFLAPRDGTLTLSTTNSTFDTLLGLYVGDRVTNLTTIAGNDDAYANAPGGFSQIVQGVKSNQTYRIAVDGYAGASGTVSLTYSFAPATVYRLTISNTVGGSVVPASTDVPANGTVVLTAFPDVNYQFDLWDGSLTSLANPLTVVVRSNMNLTAHFRAFAAATDDFESGGLQHINWTVNGPATGSKPWFVQKNVVAQGVFAASSGQITDRQSSALLLTADFTGGSGSFDYRVSSEVNWDFLSFSVDGVLQQQWSGEVGWANYAFSLPSGTHTLEWRYAKDANLSAGLDAAFLDNVHLPLVNLELRQLPDGPFLVDVLSPTNQLVIVQASTNLVDWENVATNIGTSGFLRLLDPASRTYPARFYRAIVP